jgi:hypothetical protein
MAGLIILALSLLATDSNAEYETEFVGGVGGRPFRSQCRPNDVLVGLRIRHGEALDAIAAICSPLNPARTDWAGERYRPTQYWGGNGGKSRTLQCNSGDAVHRLTAYEGPWGGTPGVIKGVRILCADLNAPHYYEIEQTPQSTVAHAGEVKCKDGDWATGLYGGSGTLVDGLGLLCNKIAAGTKVVSMKKVPRAPAPGSQADGIDLPGRDIRNLVTRNDFTCKQACGANAGCRAWTWVKNGSKCWLKDAVPVAVKSECCISGVMEKPVKSMKKAKVVTVVQSVDVCRTSGDECDEDTRIAVLEAGTPLVRLQEPCVNDRCHVKWPDGEGWVYDGPDYDSLRY